MHFISRTALVLITALSALYSTHSFAQNTHTLRGKIISGVTQKPVDFAIVYIEEANAVSNAPGGSYSVQLSKPGKYTVRIQSQGMQTLTTGVTVEGNVSMDFTLNSTSAAKQGITVRGERDIQKISRHTMTAKQIKEVPASFGDSLNALASLPGVNRPGGLFGPLIIRGAPDALNGYFIDDIPLYKPTHFGGLHSVINNDLMREIDLYSSSFPSQFGNSQAAVISINTIDEVERAGGFIDVGLISSNSLLKAPLTKSVYADGKEKKENTGYIIAAGRIGYLSLFIPPIAKYAFRKEISKLPEYWDYQFKAKYEFTKELSMTALAFGNRDYFKFLLKESYLDGGEDPLFAKTQFELDESAHSQGLYLDFKPGDKLNNRFMLYSALNENYFFINIPNASNDALKDYNITSNPNIFAVKDKFSYAAIKDHLEFRAGGEATRYTFKRKGKVLVLDDSYDGNLDSSAIKAVPLNDTITNKQYTLYGEIKLSGAGFTLVPGYHSEYLSRTKTRTSDPRLMASYEFPSRTTIAVAGGRYSMFMQTSPVFFNSNPDLAGLSYIKPQIMTHRAASIEQKIDIYLFKIEGFYNNAEGFVDSFPHTTDSGERRYYKNCGDGKTWGAEFFAKINDEPEEGLFGWTSYTWTRTLYRSNQPHESSQNAYGQSWGDTWILPWWDMTHVVKLVSGYTFGVHTLSAKFQYNTALPYTPYIGSISDDVFTARTGKPRMIPVEGKPDSARFNPDYRLDIRYTHKTPYSWGHVSWYIEVIGLIQSPSYEYKWDWRYPYASGKNPSNRKRTGLESIPVPNFGVESKF